MKFFEVFREIIGTHFPSLFLQVEENLLNYLKEFLLSKIKKNPDFFDQKLDFFADNFVQTLKKMVDTFTDGLESIGVSPVVTSRKFYSYFKEIPNEPELNTPGLWLYQRFRPFIRVLLVDEIINFFEGARGNIVEKFADFDIISSETYETFKKMRVSLPKFSQFVQSYNSIHLIYKDMNKIEHLLLFERMEENLQTLYFLVQIFKDLGEVDRFNSKLIKEFLVHNQTEWTRKTPIINPASPSTILSAITIADTLNININLTPFLEKQKDQVIRLLETDGNLLKSKHSELFDSLSSIYTVENELYPEIRSKLMGLSLSPDLIMGDLSVWTLGTILEILFMGNPSYNISADVQGKIKSHLQRCRAEGGYSVDPGDSTPNPIASYFAYRILQKVKAFEPDDLKRLFLYFIETFDRLIKIVDYSIPETVAEVFYCHQFFSALENEPDLKNMIEEFLECGAKSVEEPVKFCDPGTLEQQFHMSRKMAAQEIQELLHSPRPKPAPESRTEQGSEPQVAPNNQSPAQNVTILEVAVPPGKKLNSPTETNRAAIDLIDLSSGKKSEILVPPLEHGDIFETLRTLPSVEDAYLEKFRINYRDLVVQPQFLWNSLKRTSQYFAVLKMLHVQIRTTPAEVRDLTRKFLGARGFLGDDLLGEDVLNTCYGLGLYTQFNLLTAIPFERMQEFLISELRSCIHVNADKAFHIIMALKFLEPDLIRIPGLVPILSDFKIGNLQTADEGRKFEELFQLLLLVKAFQFESTLVDLKGSLIAELPQAIGVDGSIERLITQTAWGLISAIIVGMKATHPDLVKKMTQYLQTTTEFFSDDVRRKANWQDDEVYFALELDMLFWTLLAFTYLYPSRLETQKQIFCPKCGQFFKSEPKFCNMCGFKFVIA